MAEFQDSPGDAAQGTVVTLQDRLESLFEVGRLLATIDDLDALLARILREVHEVMQANAASMLLRVPGTDLLEFVTARGRAAEHIARRRIRIGEGISGEVARRRRIINVPDAYQDPRFNASFDKSTGFRTKQILAAPMVFRDAVVGVLSVMNRRGDKPFEPDDERILSIFSDQCSIAVINAQERRKYEQKNRAITVFSREIGRILSSELTLVYGYLHQTRRFLSKNLEGGPHASLLERVGVPLMAVEKSTDSLVRIAKTLGVFTRSTENVSPEIVSVEEALAYFVRETKYHRVRVLLEGDPSARLRLPLESLFLVIESLVETLVASMPREFDADGHVHVLFRRRVDHADFCFLASQEVAAAMRDAEARGVDAQSLLSHATIGSIVDTFDAELLDAKGLTRARISDVALDGLTPFQPGRYASEEEAMPDPAALAGAPAVSTRVALMQWQLTIPFTDPESRGSVSPSDAGAGAGGDRAGAGRAEDGARAPGDGKEGE